MIGGRRCRSVTDHAVSEATDARYASIRPSSCFVREINTDWPAWASVKPGDLAGSLAMLKKRASDLSMEMQRGKDGWRHHHLFGGRGKSSLSAGNDGISKASVTALAQSISE